MLNPQRLHLEYDANGGRVFHYSSVLSGFSVAINSPRSHSPNSIAAVLPCRICDWHSAPPLLSAGGGVWLGNNAHIIPANLHLYARVSIRHTSRAPACLWHVHIHTHQAIDKTLVRLVSIELRPAVSSRVDTLLNVCSADYTNTHTHTYIYYK